VIAAPTLPEPLAAPTLPEPLPASRLLRRRGQRGAEHVLPVRVAEERADRDMLVFQSKNVSRLFQSNFSAPFLCTFTESTGSLLDARMFGSAEIVVVYLTNTKVIQFLTVDFMWRKPV
jgi:hypothetical protein